MSNDKNILEKLLDKEFNKKYYAFQNLFIEDEHFFTHTGNGNIKMAILQNEFMRRESNKTNRRLMWLSGIAVLISIVSIFISLYVFTSTNNSDKKWQQSEIKLLQEINNKLKPFIPMKEMK